MKWIQQNRNFQHLGMTFFRGAKLVVNLDKWLLLGLLIIMVRINYKVQVVKEYK